MIIIDVKISDAENIAALDMKLFPDNCFNERTLQQEISIGAGYVAYLDGELLGYLLIRWDFANELMDIIRIGVAELHQGQGIGKKLLQHALQKNPSDAMLMAKKTNTRALKMYRRFGFEIVAQTQQSWVLVKLLTC